MNEEAQLHNHGLKSTRMRKEVLRHISSSCKALSHKELHSLLSQQADRVTLFRVLHDLEHNGLIHKALDAKGVSVYAYCRDTCSAKGHMHSHGHFQCKKCQGVYCMNQSDFMTNTVPDGFTVESVEVIVYGVCKQCSVIN